MKLAAFKKMMMTETIGFGDDTTSPSMQEPSAPERRDCSPGWLFCIISMLLMMYLIRPTPVSPESPPDAPLVILSSSDFPSRFPSVWAELRGPLQEWSHDSSHMSGIVTTRRITIKTIDYLKS